MTLQKNGDGTILTVTPDAQLNTMAARELEGELRTGIGGVKKLIFDMSSVEYITSAALRVLLCARKVMMKQGEMTVRSVRPEVMEIFEITGFIDFLSIGE